MQDIAELERRISSALSRIDRGVAGLVAPQPETAEPTAFLPESDFAKLNEDLDEERMLTAQLNERLRVVNAKHSAEVSALNAQISEQGDEISRLRESIASLTEELDDLRSVAEHSVVEPEDIDQALRAELDAMISARKADATELLAIVDALTPLVAEAETNA